MTRTGRALDNVLTQKQYEAILEYCASIKDKRKSIICFFIHLMLGYGRMRPGTLVHYQPHWYDEERQMIVVPSYEDCYCGMCRRYAAQMAKHEDEDRTTEEILDQEYWNGKTSNTAREIPLRTERQVEIVEKFNSEFDHLDKPVGSYSTLWRRATRVVELSGVMDPERYKPYVNRATAVTHFSWAGMNDAGLEYNFGWANPQTVQAYRASTGHLAAEAMEDMLGIGEYQYDLEPEDLTPWSEYRPEDEADLVEVEHWTPAASKPSPPSEDEEEAIKKMTFDDYNDNQSTANSSLLPMIGAAAFVTTAYLNRLKYEAKTMAYNATTIDPMTKRGAGQLLACTTLLAVGGVLMNLVGYSWTEIAATKAAAGVIASYQMDDLEEPPTLPRPY
jgi:hypothetical protein